MTQYNNVTIDPTVTNGAQLAANISNWRTASLSMHSGVERPAYATSGTMWISTASKPWKLFVFDGAADVAIGELDPDGHGFLSAGGTDFTNDLMTAETDESARDKLGAFSTSGGAITGFVRVLFDGATLASFQASGQSDARIEFRSNNGGNGYVEIGQRNNGDGFILSRGMEYSFRSDGILSSAAGWSVHQDGNVSGSRWQSWGSPYAFEAVSNRIEDRAAAHAGNKAPKGARIQHDSGTYDIGGCDVGFGDYTVDCAGSQALTGLQCFSGGNQWVRLRARYLRNS
ncbi:hypothetical protein [Martelella radicis]|uniref:Uncharacterized protein n=1 Tax=Martelella radicis TaxID=1397476 RepID=A0A7W6P7Z8_9HYPH|nr:hypothetical protein [Martelella radicis]MBB4120682.1 hypothetical protein [Martelella radicis]